MPELGITVKANAGQAAQEVDQFGGKLRNLGTQALEAGNLSKDGLSQMAKAASEVDPALKKIADQAFAAVNALDGLGRAGDNADRIEAGALKAQVKINDLKESIEKARAAGVELGPGVEKSVQAMDSAVGKAVVRAAELREKYDRARDSIASMKGPAADAWSELEKLGEEGRQAAEAMRALEKAGSSPIALQRAAAMAGIALEDLEKSGVHAGPAIEAALGKATQKVQEAAEKARRFADVAGDLKTRGDLAAQGFESLTGAAGSAEGMLSRLKDTGTGVQAKLADVGFAGIALAGAFTLGYESGKKFDEGLKEHGIDLSRLGDGIGGAVGLFQKFADAQNKLIPIGETNRKALKELALATNEYNQLLAPLPARINPVLNALHQKQRVAGEAREALEKLGVELQDTGNSAAHLEKVTKEFDKWANAEKLMGRLSEAASVNREKILGLRDAWLAVGKPIEALPPKLKEAIAEAEKAAGKIKALAEAHDLLAKQRAVDGLIEQYKKIDEAAKYGKESVLAYRDAWIASGQTLDSMPAKYRLLILEAERQADATEKVAKREEVLRTGMRETVSALDSIANGYKQATDAAVKNAGSADQVSSAVKKSTQEAINALSDYAKQNGLTQKDVEKLLEAQLKIAEASGKDTSALEALIEALKRLGLQAKQTAENQTEFGKALETTYPELKRWIEDGAKKWDEYRQIQLQVVQDGKKSIGELVAKYNELAAAQDAAFKAGDSTAVEETRKRMAANLEAQAEATKRLTEEAQNANIALGAFGTVTADNASKVEGMIQQTLAWRAAQEDLNRAFREGEFRLQGVAWQIRKATEHTVELSEAQQQLIEELAKLSDANPSTQLWFGHMVYQLEEDMKKGKGSIEEFQAAVQKLFQGLRELSASAPMYVGLQELETQLYRIMALLEGARGNGPFPGSPNIPQR
ncbi:MAG: hypothetical protein L6R30_20075 [Thermoanaerobaculia bacterium]|nr:hypothetical protein [Thermoanaerobaculia bacterium]